MEADVLLEEALHRYEMCVAAAFVVATIAYTGAIVV